MTTVIFDIQTSCEDHNTNSHYNMEVIEIGAIKIHQGEIIDSFQKFVKPEYISTLTPYCEKLTGITFNNLENKNTFIIAIEEFYHFIYGCQIYSYDSYNKKFILRELKEKTNSYKHSLISIYIKMSYDDIKKYYTSFMNDNNIELIEISKELDINYISQQGALSSAKHLTEIFLSLENLRKLKVKKIFDTERIEDLISNINKHHSNHYNVKMKNNNFEVKCVQTNKINTLNFLSFIDMFSQILITDYTYRNIHYINENELETLKTLAK